MRYLDAEAMESDEALIEAVKDYPCLYNNSLKDFRIVDKENAWKAVAARRAIW